VRTADLSRRHTVRTSDGGLVTVTGGKLTTYRKMAEDTVDVVVGALGRKGLRCRTKSLRLHGAPPGRRVEPKAGGAGANLRTDPDHPETTRAAVLAGRYGTEAPAVLALAAGRSELLEPLVAGLPYLAVEALWAVRHEMAGSVSDVLDRRTQSSFRDARAAVDAAPGVAALIGPELGWDADRARSEADAYAVRIRSELTRAGLDPDGSADAGDAAGPPPVAAVGGVSDGAGQAGS
jgi:glycerol-3-phosphate dehydrogenase